MSKATTKELEDRKHRATLQSLITRIKSQFSLGKIKTWTDLYRFMGMAEPDMPAGHNKPITFPQLKNHLSGMEQALESRLSGAASAPEIGEVPAEVQAAVAPSHTYKQPVMATVKPVSEPLQQLGAEQNYGLVASPNERTFYYWFQKKAISELYNGLVVENKRAMLLLASTGLGKTFMALGLIRRMVDQKFADPHSFGATLYLIVTKATIVEQWRRVAQKYFNLSMKDGVEVINIEQLRSRAGAQWVKERMEIVNGQETWFWDWRPMLNPVVIVWDESQGLKNDTSTQHKIGVSFNEIKTSIYQVFVSATPFTRVCEAKCFAVATHKDISDTMATGVKSHLTNETWPTYAQAIAGSQSTPAEYNEAAVERLVKDLDPYIVRVRGVRPQFGANNRTEIIGFQSREAMDYYMAAWERYLKEKAKAEAEAANSGQKESGLDRLTRILKFRMAGEMCKTDIYAERMFNDVSKHGLAAVAALNFKGTVIGVVKILIEKYGVSRDQISLVWGGGKTSMTKKEKAAVDIKNKVEKLIAAGMSVEQIYKDLDIEPEDLLRAEEKQAQELPESYRLGPQSKEERQREIDRFQSGKTLYCLFTMRAGGVGLSLHHTDEFSPVKCRRKESGYAIEEDIPLVPIRPRRNYVAPTYSAIELVQALGRCPRLTSLSETEQILLFYRGTIEVEVAAITATKLGCLGKVVRQKEDWMDLLETEGQSKEAHLSSEMDKDDPDALEGGEEEEE